MFSLKIRKWSVINDEVQCTLHISLLLKVDTATICQSVIAESFITFQEAGRRSQVLKTQKVIVIMQIQRGEPRLIYLQAFICF